MIKISPYLVQSLFITITMVTCPQINGLSAEKTATYGGCEEVYGL